MYIFYWFWLCQIIQIVARRIFLHFHQPRFRIRESLSSVFMEITAAVRNNAAADQEPLPRSKDLQGTKMYHRKMVV